MPYRPPNVQLILNQFSLTKNLKHTAIASDCCTDTVKRVLLKNGVKWEKSVSILNRRYDLKHNIFSCIDSAEKAYWLGLLAADGDVSKKKRTVRLGLKESDKALLERFRIFVGTNKPLSKETRVLNNKRFVSYRITLSSMQIIEDLSKHGIEPCKSFTLGCPNINPRFYKDYIRGYFDGDGCLSSNTCKGYCMSAVSMISSKKVCLFIMEILEKAGISAKIDQCKYTDGRNHMHLVRVGGNYNVEGFCRYIYDETDLYLTRKHDKYLQLRDTIFTNGRKKGGYIKQVKNRFRYDLASNRQRFQASFSTKQEAFDACRRKCQELGLRFQERKLILNNPDCVVTP